MPRRRTIFIGLAVALCLFGGVALFSRIGRSEILENKAATAQAVQKATEILSKDTDGDGLKDWEEELWKTDPQNPDTDGDGTPDGEEIRVGRDPLKPGPNDLLDRETVSTKTTAGAGDTAHPLSLSEQISRELFSQYMASKQAGKPFTANDEKKILLHFFNNPPPLAETKQYTDADLSVGGNGEEELRVYGNNLAAILIRHSAKGSENELLTLQAAVEAEDETKLEKLKDRFAGYDEAEKELLTLSIPKEMTALHRNLVNAIAAMKAGVGGMQLIFKDPVKSLETIGQYPTGLDQFYATITAIGKFLIEKKVEFKADEPGAQLVK